MNTYVSVQMKDQTIKVTNDKDCLPPGAGRIASYHTVGEATPEHVLDRFHFWYDRVKWIEEVGFTVILDFGVHYYETPVHDH